MIQLEHVLPADIEKTSFSIIACELAQKEISLPEELAPIIMRVIHTTADFEYAQTLKFSPNVVEIIKNAVGYTNRKNQHKLEKCTEYMIG